MQAFTKPEEWYWVSGVENIADLGTRPNATVQDVYQEEPECLKLEEGFWPAKTARGRFLAEIPKEELNSKIAETKFHRIEAVDGVIMNNSHDIMHSVVKHTLARSRKWVWIIKGKRLSETVVKNCNYCELERSSS